MRRAVPLFAAIGALAGLLLLGVAGCGASRSGTQSPDGAGEVALDYTNDLFTGDYDSVKALVQPSDRSGFQLINAGVEPGGADAENLGVGSVSLAGVAATVVLTGSVCRTATPGDPGGCITNSDPNSDNPIFRVSLRQDSGSWQVVFQAPTPAGSQTDPASPSN